MPGVPIVLPEPYDFHRSTFRFRTFGRDAASVWHDDALYRVLRSGVVVRVSADGIASDRPTDARDEADAVTVIDPFVGVAEVKELDGFVVGFVIGILTVRHYSSLHCTTAISRIRTCTHSHSL